ncbi:hypothetical protein ABZ930_10475 [Streptomyces sp. NPDC046716]|uniref:hypothetical protein n=1 Tax=Streptomyces sp. NPDC046716 TaxID=3157093 RepID=UPI0033C1599B
MHTRIAAAAMAAALAFGAVACSSGDTKADPAACKAAMKKQFDEAMKKGGDAAAADERPEACEGIDDKTAQRFAKELMGDAMDDAMKSAVPDIDPDDVTASPPGTDDIQESLDAIESDLDDALDEAGITPSP